MEKGGLRSALDAVGSPAVDGLFWGDEMRVGLIGQVRKIWAPRGVKVVQIFEYQHVWAYLNLAVNGLTGELRWRWTANMKGESLAPVVKQWSTEGVTTLVWDRARGHRGPAYAAVEVQRIEQPPYSPELNPAERVFEYLRAQIEGKVYGTIAAKQQAVEAELAKLAADPAKVRSLAGWLWIREAVIGLPQTNMVSQ